ncbi:MAG: Crp/Fnr family transcriptional regulator [Syntrophobacter sp.]
MSPAESTLNPETHPYLKRFSPEHLALLEQCATIAEFEEGSYLFREREQARKQFLLLEGRVALELNAPGQDPWILMTSGANSIVGYAWAYPPYRYWYNCRVMQKTRAIVLDAEWMAAKCKEDHEFGYEILLGCTEIMAQRIQAADLQLLNLLLKCY